MLNLLSGVAAMDSTYFAEGIIGGLEISCYPEGRIPHERRVTLHFDNVLVYNSKCAKEKRIISGFIRMKYPPSSPDLAPCDFFLFSDIREKLKDTVFSDEEDLSVAIRCIMTVIPRNLLLSVFSQ
jgi:hypothetical protein